MLCELSHLFILSGTPHLASANAAAKVIRSYGYLSSKVECFKTTNHPYTIIRRDLRRFNPSLIGDPVSIVTCCVTLSVVTFVSHSANL